MKISSEIEFFNVWALRFERFRFSVQTVPVGKWFLYVSLQCQLRGTPVRFRLQFLKTVPAVPVLLSVPGKTVPTVPVSASGSVLEPSCNISLTGIFLFLGLCYCLGTSLPKNKMKNTYKVGMNRKRAEYGFGEHGLKH